MTTIAYTSKDAYSLEDLPVQLENVYRVTHSRNGYAYYEKMQWKRGSARSNRNGLCLGLIHRTPESARLHCDMLNGKVGERVAARLHETLRDNENAQNEVAAIKILQAGQERK